ncbi:hypothetical protein EV291_107126 [Rhizobium sp. BK068]|nr:hypothetical protein EV291_107126 [Rhizobium sp. BK068]
MGYGVDLEEEAVARAVGEPAVVEAWCYLSLCHINLGSILGTIYAYFCAHEDPFENCTLPGSPNLRRGTAGVAVAPAKPLP